MIVSLVTFSQSHTKAHQPTPANIISKMIRKVERETQKSKQRIENGEKERSQNDEDEGRSKINQI